MRFRQGKGSLLAGRESILSRSQRWQRCAPGPCPHVQRWLSAKSDRRYVCPRSNPVAFAASRVSNDTSPRPLENRRANTCGGEKRICVDDLVTVSNDLWRNDFIFSFEFGTVRFSPASARSCNTTERKWGNVRPSNRVSSCASRANRDEAVKLEDPIVPRWDYLSRRLALGDPTPTENVDVNILRATSSYVFIFRE